MCFFNTEPPPWRCLLVKQLSWFGFKPKEGWGCWMGEKSRFPICTNESPQSALNEKDPALEYTWRDSRWDHMWGWGVSQSGEGASSRTCPACSQDLGTGRWSVGSYASPREMEWKCSNHRTTAVFFSGSESRAESGVCGREEGKVPFPLSPSHLPWGQRIQRKAFVRNEKPLTRLDSLSLLDLVAVGSPSN